MPITSCEFASKQEKLSQRVNESNSSVYNESSRRSLFAEWDQVDDSNQEADRSIIVFELILLSPILAP